MDHKGLLFLVSLSVVVFFQLSLHWAAGNHPTGDEGSWMAVGAQLARGEGFTTHWLEHHWQKPYTLPRPTEFRYPALSTTLAIGFTLAKFDYATGLKTIAWVFIAFLWLFAWSCRRILGWRTTVVAIPLAGFSLLQQYWNSQIYTEGLFACGICLVMFQAHRTAAKPNSYWHGWLLGGFIGLTYLVRPNAILLLGGAMVISLQSLWYRFFNHSSQETFARGLSFPIVFLGFLSTAWPWLLRSQILFGNPFHIAGSAGLLRDQFNESHNQGITEYFGQHSILFPLQKLGIGFWNFLGTLTNFEHGMNVLPLLAFGVCAGILGFHQWKKTFAFNQDDSRSIFDKVGCFFFSIKPFQLFGLGAWIPSLLACFYAAYDGWAGVRYATPFMPWIYAWGIHFILRQNKWPWLQGKAIPWVMLGLLILPVIQPHRFYLRRFHSSHELALRGTQEADHTRQLKENLKDSDIYYAKSMCQLNFMDTLKCIGLQELYDTTWFRRSEQQFHPNWIVIAPAESLDMDLGDAFSRLNRTGYQLILEGETPLARIFKIERKPNSIPSGIEMGRPFDQ